LFDSGSTRTQDARPRSIEDAASLTGILAAAANQLSAGRKSALGVPGETPTAAALVSAAEAGDELASELLEYAARVHGWIVHQLATLLDPELLIMAGPLAVSDKYLQAVRQAAAELSAAPLETRIVRSTLGEFAGALGAAALAFHYWKPRR
jgi:predicted NBD/HSP70 family sugar kinase